VLTDELHQVLVGAHDDGIEPLGLRAARERPDHVVGLDSGDLEHWYPQRLDQAPDVRLLRPKVVGQRGAMLLVALVERAPEGLPRRVEHADHPGRILVAQQLRQHSGEAEHGVRGKPAVGRQGRQRVKGTMHVGASVDHMEASRQS
jgi:hypothetical protein